MDIKDQVKLTTCKFVYNLIYQTIPEQTTGMSIETTVEIFVVVKKVINILGRYSYHMNFIIIIMICLLPNVFFYTAGIILCSSS